MSTPFPGMNPYLESDLWGDFHLELAATAKHQLLPLLAPNYYPFIEKYFLLDIEGVADCLEPDTGVIRGGAGQVRKSASWQSPVVMEIFEPFEVSHHRIEIRDPE